MQNLKQQEQYEVIRLLLATRKDIKVCLHGLTNIYVQQLLDELGIPIQDCSVSAEPGQSSFQ